MNHPPVNGPDIQAARRCEIVKKGGVLIEKALKGNRICPAHGDQGEEILILPADPVEPITVGCLGMFQPFPKIIRRRLIGELQDGSLQTPDRLTECDLLSDPLPFGGISSELLPA